MLTQFVIFLDLYLFLIHLLKLFSTAGNKSMGKKLLRLSEEGTMLHSLELHKDRSYTRIIYSLSFSKHSRNNDLVVFL